MITRKECISRIQANSQTIIEEYGVRSLRLFGSLARDEQKESSDVDVFVDMDPDIIKMAGLKQYLEDLLKCKVDLIRKHNNNDLYLLKQVEKDGIFIIREAADSMAYA